MVSSNVYWGIWTALFLAWGSLTYQYARQLPKYHTSLAGDIRGYNARNGNDQSIDKELLASDLMVPFRNENLKKYAINNNLEHYAYRNRLINYVGKQRVWSIAFLHIAGIGFHILGLSHLFPGGFIPPTVFIISSSVIFLISLIGYLLMVRIQIL